jgi:hypothetical protein
MRRLVLLILLIALCGCGDRVRVRGHVKFADGSPLTVGEVRFVSEKMVFSGTLKTDGSYELGSGGSANGIVPGKYEVSIEHSGVPGETKPGKLYPEIIPLIAAKYTDYGTSGISCEVKGSTTFDITVEKP